jgi:tetratricopeptide (TPR) repeat protein
MKLFDSSSDLASRQDAWYVDRQDVCEAVRRELIWHQDVAPRVLVFHGPGGVGKTTARKLVERDILRPVEIPYVVVDYEHDEGSLRSCESTFSYMRRQFVRSGLKFPAFDLVWARYWEETTQQRLSQTNFPPEFSDIADIMMIIPIVGNVPGALSGLMRVSRSAASWVSRRLLAGDIETLREMTAVELLHLMPEAIGRDLEENIQRKQNRGRNAAWRLTIIFDAFEQLAEHGVDDWFISEFCNEAGSSLTIIFGREQLLPWIQKVPQWASHLEHRPAMTSLDEGFANEYLIRRGLSDIALRRYIIDLTEGFPYHLALAADLCDQIRRLEGRPASPSDLADQRRSQHLGDDLLNRILRQLRGDEPDAVRLAAIPRWFTEETLEVMLAEPASSRRLFQAIRRFSFCQEMSAVSQDSPAVMVRKEARRILRSQLRAARNWKSWNTALRDHHLERRAHFSHLAEAIYHAFAVDVEHALQVLTTEFYDLLHAWKFSDCRALLQTVPGDEDLPATAVQQISLMTAELMHEAWENDNVLPAAAEILDGLLVDDLTPALSGRASRARAIVDIKLGDRSAALTRLSKALHCLTEPSDARVRANVLRHIGDVYFAGGNFNESLAAYMQARDVYTDLGQDWRARARPEEQAGGAQSFFDFMALGDTLKAIAGLYARTGRMTQSITPLEEMLRIGRQVGDVRTQAEAMSELGLVYRRLGQLDRAREIYKDALLCFEEIRSPTGQAHVRCGLGMTAEQAGDITMAASHYADSSRLFHALDDRLGKAKLIHCLGRIQDANGHHSQAGDLYAESLALYLETGYRAQTGAVLIDLARLAVRETRLDEAAKRCKEAEAVYRGLDDKVALAAVWTNEGVVHLLQGQIPNALALLTRARTEYHELFRSPAGRERSRRSSLTGGRLIERLWVSFLQMYDPKAHALTCHELDTAIHGLRGQVDRDS